MIFSRRTRRKLNEALSALLRFAGTRALRSLVCIVLCVILCTDAVTVGAFALDWKDLASTKGTGPNSEAAASSTAGGGTGGNGTNGKNYYILEVASGTRLGGGYADNVLYFSVHYTDVDGVKRNSILMPGVDAVSDGFQTAYDISSPKMRQDLVNEVFDYHTNSIVDRKALGSVTNDQILFETPTKIDTVDMIQIFGKRTPSASVWPCQGMRVYDVEKIYGLEMYGWFSDMGYIDFDGSVIAEVVMAPGGGNFNWNTTGGTFNITTAEAGKPKDVAIVHTKNKDSYESYYKTETHVGIRVSSQSRKPVVIRMDFADQSGAGLDSLVVSYDQGAAPKIGNARFCEAAALQVRYEDIFGCQRDVTLPLVINSLGSAVEVLGKDISIAAYAQQGDSIAIPALLPNMARIVDTKLTIGEEEARQMTGILPGPGASQNPIYKARTEATKTDDISYTCLAYYTDVDVKVALEGAVIRYSYDAGANNPAYFAAATSIDGLSIKAKKTTSISTLPYYDKLTLKPSDRQDRYLITLSTDNVANAGTTSDLQIQFKYINIKDKETTSPLYHVNDYVDAFYGTWMGNVDDFPYKWTMRDGGTAQFMIPLQDVQEFTGVSFKLEGDDEWQFSGLRIDKVAEFYPRSVDWKEMQSIETDSSGNPRYKTHVEIGRTVDISNLKDKPLFQIGVVYQQGEDRPDGGSDDWIPGTLIQDDDETSEFNGKGEIVDKRDEIDWGSILHYMTYEQAQQDLKFTKQRANYKVSVHVGGDKVNADDDDCGSKNLFYFQLIFENGKSGCMLANQQIQGDAFRTGTTSEFYIPCAQDYGDLIAIQVIPDDQDGNSDIYDKLKIASIDVEKMTDNFICPTWGATSAGEEGLGWVGIDYRDQGEISSNTGAEGRTISEIATTYQITESSYNAKFLVSITTGNYNVVPRPDENGRPVYIQDPIYSGGMTMSYNYFDRDGKMPPTVSGIDVVKLMNEYSARSGSYLRKTELAEENYEVPYAVSDPSYNFRPGKTDSFYITVKNISQFINMSLQLRSDVRTHWNVNAIKIYLVNGQGLRYLNGSGEFEYKYPEGKKPTLVAEWTRDEGLTADCGIFRYKQDTGIQEIANIAFDCDPIDLNPDATGWTSVVAREPKSKNDAFNLYIYPQTVGENVAKPGTYNLKAAVRYKNAVTLTHMQSSAGLLRNGYDDEGNITCFYQLGIDGTNLDSIDGVDVETNSLVKISAPITRGVLQVVRGGVLINSYELSGVANADLGDTMSISTNPRNYHHQKILLQLSNDTTSQTIEPEVKDLAVAMHFRSDLPEAQELRSKYVYLSDAGYSKVEGGKIYEIDMDLGNLAEISAVNVLTLGNLDVTIDSISAVEVDDDGNVYNTFSARGPYTPNGRAGRIDAFGLVTPLTLSIATAEDDSAVSSGTAGPVRMRIGYYDSYGALREDVYENIRPYISSGRGFEAGGTDVVSLMVPEMAELRWIEFEPLRNTSATSNSVATWKIASVSASTGYDGRVTTRTVNQLVTEGDPIHIGFADILISGEVKTFTTNEKGETVESTAGTVSMGDTLPVLLESGNNTVISTNLIGSVEGFSARVETYDPSSGAKSTVVKLSPSLRYSESYLNEVLGSAKKSAETGYTQDERSAANAVIEQINKMLNASAGNFRREGSNYIFSTPYNDSGRDQHYLITIYSNENTEALYAVDVAVPSQADMLTTAITNWRNMQNLSSQIQAADAANAGSSSSSPDTPSSGGAPAESGSSGGAPAESGSSGGAPADSGSSGDAASGGESSGGTPGGSEASGGE